MKLAYLTSDGNGIISSVTTKTKKILEKALGANAVDGWIFIYLNKKAPGSCSINISDSASFKMYNASFNYDPKVHNKCDKLVRDLKRYCHIIAIPYAMGIISCHFNGEILI